VDIGLLPSRNWNHAILSTLIFVSAENYNNHLHAGRLQPPRASNYGILHESRVKPRATFSAHDGEQWVHRLCEEVHAPHTLGSEEEGLEQLLRQCAHLRPPERHNHLAHLGLRQADEPLVIVLGAVEQDPPPM
jgi:hypothetical protein